MGTIFLQPLAALVYGQFHLARPGVNLKEISFYRLFHGRKQLSIL